MDTSRFSVKGFMRFAIFISVCFRTGIMNVSTKNLSACERTVIIASETIIEMTSAYFSESDMRRVSA